MSERLSGNIEAVLQGAIDAMQKQADDNLVRTMVLESVLYAALDRMKHAAVLDDGWATLLSFIANNHRDKAAKNDSKRTAFLLNRVADGVDQYSKIVPADGTFNPPSLTVIHGGKTTLGGEE
ncbi:hypothetical protein [Mesorhizobium sp. M0220]|uniref:hypothetical protein n=1 Tax=Mesorhizobium sp. M0220 TaxID=2956920 RepID=UPI003339115D